MPKARRPKWRRVSTRTGQLKQTRQYILEEGSIQDLIAQKELTQAELRFNWDYYSELAYQRKQIEPQLLAALNENSISNFEFEHWQRGMKYKYSLHPFCTIGSLSDPGGRFNIGDISAQNFPKFPALYVAADKDTAFQETLGQPETGTNEITALERALANPQSFTCVSVSGKIERIFDLRNPKSLKEFARLTSDFKFSKSIHEQARKLGVDPPQIIQSVELLIDSFLTPDWRHSPMRFDIPANPQIFGHLIYLAQIEGVIYPSKFTGKPCVALFPHHFASTSSYIELDDEPPHPNVPRRVDSNNWKICDLTASEIIGAAGQG